MSHYGVLVYDIEANGLYYPWEEEVADRIHCIAATDHSGKVYVYVNDVDIEEAEDYCFEERNDVSFLAPLSEFNEDVKNYDGLVCHNQLHYDLPMLKKFIGLEYDFSPMHVNGHRIQIIDTLVDSRWLYPDRPVPRGCPSAIKNPVTGKLDKVGPHGLMAWTYRTSGSKPVVHDWRNQPLAVYIERCIEDAKNNLLVFNWLNREMAEWYKCSTKPEHWKTVRNKAKTCINVETAFSHVIFKQQEHGVGFNQKLAKSFLPKLDQMIQEVRDRVEPKLPRVPIPKSRLGKDWSFPAKCFNNDGKPSASLMKWIEKHNGAVWCDLETRKNKLDAYGKTFDFPLPDYVKTHEELTLYNSTELKKYLMQIGWKPVYWNYKKDPKTNRYMRDDDKQLIPTTPRLKDAATGMICPNLLDMDSDVAKDVVLFNSLKHRRQTIESTANEEKGYLNHPRLEYDGRLPAMATPCGAGTKRVTHRVVANVPKAEEDVVFGKELRSLFYASEPDYYFIGYDASAIEARLEGNEAFSFDRGEYAKLLLEGDCHTSNAEFFSKRSGNTIKRGKAKGIKYALTYGAGPGKIAVMLDVPVPRAKEILDEYWCQYWAVDKAKQKLVREWNRNKQLKIKDIMGGPLWIRSEHSIFNYRLQNAGTSVMKLSAVLMYQWLKEEIDQELANKVIDYHDEAQWEVHKKLVKWKKINDEEEGKNLQKQGYSKPIKVNNQWFVADSKVGRSGIESIKRAGEILRIKVPLTGEWCCGKNWSQTH